MQMVTSGQPVTCGGWFVDQHGHRLLLRVERFSRAKIFAVELSGSFIRGLSKEAEAMPQDADRMRSGPGGTLGSRSMFL